MPWTAAQHRLFEAAKHDPAIAKRHGLSHATAAKLAHEGVSEEEKKKALFKKLMSGHGYK